MIVTRRNNMPPQNDSGFDNVYDEIDEVARLYLTDSAGLQSFRSVLGEIYWLLPKDKNIVKTWFEKLNTLGQNDPVIGADCVEQWRYVLLEYYKLQYPYAPEVYHDCFAQMMAPLASVTLHPYSIDLELSQKECLLKWLKNPHIWHDIKKGQGEFTDDAHSNESRYKVYHSLINSLRSQLRELSQQKNAHKRLIYFKAAIALGEFQPLNSEDVVSQMQIDPQERVVVSTGRQLSLESIAQAAKYKRGYIVDCLNQNSSYPAYDEAHILDAYKACDSMQNKPNLKATSENTERNKYSFQGFVYPLTALTYNAIKDVIETPQHYNIFPIKAYEYVDSLARKAGITDSNGLYQFIAPLYKFHNYFTTPGSETSKKWLQRLNKLGQVNFNLQKSIRCQWHHFLLEFYKAEYPQAPPDYHQVMCAMTVPLAKGAAYPYDYNLNEEEKPYFFEWLTKPHLWHNLLEGKGELTDDKHANESKYRPYVDLLKKLRLKFQEYSQYQPNEKKYWDYYSAAIALGEFQPINGVDDVTLEKIDPQDRVVVSSGFQMSLGSIINWSKCKGFFENPRNRERYSGEDKQHILEAYFRCDNDDKPELGELNQCFDTNATRYKDFFYPLSSKFYNFLHPIVSNPLQYGLVVSTVDPSVCKIIEELKQQYQEVASIVSQVDYYSQLFSEENELDPVKVGQDLYDLGLLLHYLNNQLKSAVKDAKQGKRIPSSSPYILVLSEWLFDNNFNIKPQLIKNCFKHRGYAACLKLLIRGGTDPKNGQVAIREKMPVYTFSGMLTESLHSDIFGNSIETLPQSDSQDFYENGLYDLLNTIVPSMELYEKDLFDYINKANGQERVFNDNKVNKFSFLGHPSSRSGDVMMHETLKALLHKFDLLKLDKASKAQWCRAYNQFLALLSPYHSYDQTNEPGTWWFGEVCHQKSFDKNFIYMNEPKEIILLALLNSSISPFHFDNEQQAYSQSFMYFWVLYFSVLLRTSSECYEHHFPPNNRDPLARSSQVTPPPARDLSTDSLLSEKASAELKRTEKTYPYRSIEDTLKSMNTTYQRARSNYKIDSHGLFQVMVARSAGELVHFIKTEVKQYIEDKLASFNEIETACANQKQCVLLHNQQDRHIKLVEAQKSKWQLYYDENKKYQLQDVLALLPGDSQLNMEVFSKDKALSLIESLIKRPVTIDQWVDLYCQNIVPQIPFRKSIFATRRDYLKLMGWNDDLDFQSGEVPEQLNNLKYFEQMLSVVHDEFLGDRVVKYGKHSLPCNSLSKQHWLGQLASIKLTPKEKKDCNTRWQRLLLEYYKTFHQGYQEIHHELMAQMMAPLAMMLFYPYQKTGFEKQTYYSHFLEWIEKPHRFYNFAKHRGLIDQQSEQDSQTNTVQGNKEEQSRGLSHPSASVLKSLRAALLSDMSKFYSSGEGKKAMAVFKALIALAEFQPINTDKIETFDQVCVSTGHKLSISKTLEYSRRKGKGYLLNYKTKTGLSCWDEEHVVEACDRIDLSEEMQTPLTQLTNYRDRYTYKGYNEFTFPVSQQEAEHLLQAEKKPSSPKKEASTTQASQSAVNNKTTNSAQGSNAMPMNQSVPVPSQSQSTASVKQSACQNTTAQQMNNSNTPASSVTQSRGTSATNSRPTNAASEYQASTNYDQSNYQSNSRPSDSARSNNIPSCRATTADSTNHSQSNEQSSTYRSVGFSKTIKGNKVIRTYTRAEAVPLRSAQSQSTPAQSPSTHSTPTQPTTTRSATAQSATAQSATAQSATAQSATAQSDSNNSANTANLNASQSRQQRKEGRNLKRRQYAKTTINRASSSGPSNDRSNSSFFSKVASAFSGQKQSSNDPTNNSMSMR